MQRGLFFAVAIAVMGIPLGYAATVYEATGSPHFRSAQLPPRVLDDGTFTPGTVPSTGLKVGYIEFGFSVYGTGNANVNAEIRFYDNKPFTSPPSVDNPDYLGGFNMTFENLEPGYYTTGLVDITTFGGVWFLDDDWAVEVVLTDPTTGAPSNRATPMFAGASPQVGSNQNLFWRDVNEDWMYDETAEARSIAAPNNAQLYLKLIPVTTLSVEVVLAGFQGTSLSINEITTLVDIDDNKHVPYLLTSVTGNIGSLKLDVMGDGGAHLVRIKPEGYLSQSITITTDALNKSAVFAGPLSTGLLAGDADGDNDVDDFDLSSVIYDFGSPPSGNNGYTDFDGNGIVNDFDLFTVIINISKTGT